MSPQAPFVLISRRCASVLLAALVATACAVAPSDDPVGTTAAAIAGDGSDPAQAPDDKVLAPAFVGPDAITLHVSFGAGAGWANIANGAPGDEVWLDRSFDAGNTWESQLGYTTIPAGATAWRTLMYVWNDPSLGRGQIRACGRTGAVATIACTPWLPTLDLQFDGVDPASHKGDRPLDPLSWVWWRQITLHISDPDRMAWASIGEGAVGDEVWIDRSWNGGATWDSQLGDAVSPQTGGWRTWMYNFDDPAHGGVGALRACGRAVNTTDIRCTPFTSLADPLIDVDVEGAASLATRVSAWAATPDRSVDWWWAANAVTALIDYIDRTGSCVYWSMIQSVYSSNVAATTTHGAEFTNTYYDDTGWWALAWLRAYQVGPRCGDTAYSAYLSTVVDAFRYMSDAWDTTLCGGGIWWMQPAAPNATIVKNAIANELFLAVAAGLYETTRAAVYLGWAEQELAWFKVHAMQDSRGLIEDGAVVPAGPAMKTGSSPPQPTWCGPGPDPEVYTYNQGVILGALAVLASATGEPATYLPYAEAIADDAVNDLVANSVLRDDCEPTSDLAVGPHEWCTGYMNTFDKALDETMFKGIFVRNLRALYDEDVSAGRTTADWSTFLTKQATSIGSAARSGRADFGYHWAGPIRFPEDVNIATQASGVDAFNAAAGL